MVSWVIVSHFLKTSQAERDMADSLESMFGHVY